MAPTIKRLLAEIHHRSLWQVAGVYLAGSWVVLQVVDILVDSLALPRGLPALAILLILLGLPVVLATAVFQGEDPLRRLLREVHRGSLWQRLGVYLAGSWVALELIDILVDSMGWPQWLPALTVLLILLGLPFVAATGSVGGSGRAGFRSGFGLIPGQGVSPVDVQGSDRAVTAHVPSRFFNWRNAIIGGTVASSVWGIIAAGWLLTMGFSGSGVPEEGLDLDPNVVAVFPFHVTGPEDLAFLGEGMVDLLAAKLSGEGGPRAADPRSVMSAWHRAVPDSGEGIGQGAALGIGRALGAGQILMGDIVGTPSGLVLSASAFAGEGGRLLARASVEGPPDSLTSLIDRLTVQLLALEAEREDQRLADLTSQSLPALRAYLDGQRAYREGNYSEADQLFERALGVDSTFALAALGRVSSSWWRPGYERFNRARWVAWNLRERLSPRDRTLLEAWAGPNYPRVSSWAEHLRMWETAIAAAPERPEPWYESGDIYFHYGPQLGVSDAMSRAEARFRRASELDSTFAAPVGHLLELAALRGDTAGVGSFAAAYEVMDSTGDVSDFLQWRAVSVLGDSAAVTAMRRRFPGFAVTSLNRILGLSQIFGSNLDDAELAASSLAGRAGTRVERWEWLTGLHAFALNRGRPREALRWIEASEEVEDSLGEQRRIRVLDALFWDGDLATAARTVGLLEERIDASPGAEEGLGEADLADVCVAEVWRLQHGDTSTAQRSLQRFLTSDIEGSLDSNSLNHSMCVATIEALLAVAEERPDAEEAVDRLDVLLLLGPYVETGDAVALIGNFIVADWREAQGDLAGALAVMRRRHYHFLTGVRYLSTYLREEGRLAALIGDREGAIQAFQHYVNLRSEPEPELAPELERARAELENLIGEAIRR